MMAQRKANPTHITRYERITYSEAGDHPERVSYYNHGIVVPPEYLGDIQLKGQVRIEETHAEEWGRRIDEHDDDVFPWDDNYRSYAQRMAGNSGLATETIWSVGHIVWPGEEGKTCDDCPYGAGTVPGDYADVIDDTRRGL